MTIGPHRPMWALIADVLIEENIAKSKNIDKEVTMNTYLQSWFPKGKCNLNPPTGPQKDARHGEKIQPTLRHIKNTRKREETAPCMVPPRSRRQPGRVQLSSGPPSA